MNDSFIGVVGLGYVGLPLAIEFNKVLPVIGFDVNENRITELKAGNDITGELTREQLSNAKNLHLTSYSEDLARCNVFIVTVPTPVDENKKPDFSFLLLASKTVGKILKPGDLVIYESTVYPGATEEISVPVLARESGLEFNREFFVGYSPERINPGDSERKINNIVKVTSGSTDEAATKVDNLYQLIIEAGTHKCSSIRVAEAAKVIENTQRDVNIALINELAILFNRLGIDTYEVLEAAKTKWNFLPFAPGLVGGHCIGVDPYYLTHKAQSSNFHPEMILAGRRVNDGMGKYIAKRIVKTLCQKQVSIHDAKILVLGFTFKENCPDIRNTKVIDIHDELTEFCAEVTVYDPNLHSLENTEYERVNIINSLDDVEADAVVVTVKHDVFMQMGLERIKSMSKHNIVFDIKCMFGVREDTYRI